MSLVACLRHMGDLYGGYGFKNLGKTMEGLAYYEQAKVLVLAVAAQFPTNVDVTKESYKTLLSLAPAEAAIGRHDEAAKDLAEALTQIQKVSVAEPADTNVKVELAVGESRLAQMLLDDRKFVSALPHAARSSELLQRLLDADPSNAIYRRGQSIVETQWAAALRGVGQVDDAVAHSEQALQLAQALSKDAPGSAQYRSDVGANERKLSEGLVAAGKAEAALQHAEQGERILCQNEASSTDFSGLAACGRVMVVAGNAYRALHDTKAAIAVLQKALLIASARTQADAASLIFRADCARAQAALAGALADSGDTQGAVAMYEASLKTWDVLRQAKSISVEDAYRSDAAAQALAGLRSH
jgi:tetratricopeptide (TPR) repeat protein